jgi:protein involved in polysaccharide export with SLBB domain
MNSFVRIARLSLLLGGLLAIASLFTACETTSVSGDDSTLRNVGANAEPASPDRNSTDLLHPGDIVIITFSGATDPPSRHEDRVQENGKITLAYVGTVQAGGKTRAELQQEITRLYVPKYYRQLTVNVNPDTRYFTVSGEVRSPSRVMYLGRSTVLKAIAAAGDFTDFAQPKKVVVTRGNGKKVKVNCIKARTSPELDVEIFPDDHIHVPRRLF